MTCPAGRDRSSRELVIRAADDFPGRGGRSLDLLCGCSTCCCMTFVIGAVGLGVGAIAGSIVGVRAASPSPLAKIALLFAGALVGALVGLILGGGIGFAIDSVVL